MSKKVKINWIDVKSERQKVVNETKPVEQQPTEIKQEIKQDVAPPEVQNNTPNPPNLPEVQIKRQPIKIDLNESISNQQPKQFDIDRYIMQKFTNMKQPEVKQVTINDLQKRKIIKRKERKFDFTFKNPLGGIMENPFLLAGSVAGLFILQQNIL